VSAPRGEQLVAPDIPAYPRDWPPEQRVDAYWQAIRDGWMPTSTEQWRQVYQRALSRRNRIETVFNQTAFDDVPDSGDMPGGQSPSQPPGSGVP
jgi:hypothetical protein